MISPLSSTFSHFPGGVYTPEKTCQQKFHWFGNIFESLPLHEPTLVSIRSFQFRALSCFPSINKILILAHLRIGQKSSLARLAGHRFRRQILAPGMRMSRDESTWRSWNDPDRWRGEKVHDRDPAVQGHREKRVCLQG